MIRNWTLISVGIRGAASVLSILLSVVLSRSLGIEEFGKYATLLAAYGFLMLLVEMGFSPLTTRSYFHDDTRFPPAYVLRFARTWIASVSAVCGAGAVLILIWAGFEAPYLAAAIFTLLVAATAATHVESAHLRALEYKFYSIAFEQLTRYFLPLIVIPLGHWVFGIDWTAVTALGVIAAAYTVSALVCRRMTSRHHAQLGPESPLARRVHLRRIPRDQHLGFLASSLFLTMNKTYGVVSRNLDLLLISAFVGFAASGEYRVATVLSTAILIAVPAVTNVVATDILRAYKGEGPDLADIMYRSAWAVFAISSLANILMILGSGFVINLLFGPEFVGALGPLIILCAFQWAVTALGLPNYLLNMTGSERIVFRSSMITLGLNAIGNLAMIPLLGANGAALATGIAAIAFAVLCWADAKRLHGVDCSIFARLPWRRHASTDE